jgi:hypothetical protein
MKTQSHFGITRRALPLAIATALCGVSLLLPINRATAQEPTAGPLPAAAPSDRPVQPKPRGPTLIGGKPNLSGTWILNKDDSDDARKKLEDAQESSSSHSGGNRPGIGMGHGGVWGGPGGNPYPHTGGGGGSGGSHSHTGPAADFMDELSQITVVQTESTARVTAESGHLLADYPVPQTSHANPSSTSSGASSGGTSTGTSSGTSSGTAGGATGAKSSDTTGSNSGSTTSANSGGGQAPNSPAPARVPPTVEWQGNQLVVVEQGSHGATTTRTFELSPEGNQLELTTTIDNPRFKDPVTIRFVYDPAPQGE